ncbi:hypothetical protein OAV13_01015 [bacterium]|nr:hypothetical protein [bacterium]
MSKGIEAGRKCEVVVVAATEEAPVSIKQSVVANKVTTRTEDEIAGEVLEEAV